MLIVSCMAATHFKQVRMKTCSEQVNRVVGARWWYSSRVRNAEVHYMRKKTVRALEHFA